MSMNEESVRTALRLRPGSRVSQSTYHNRARARARSSRKTGIVRRSQGAISVTFCRTNMTMGVLLGMKFGENAQYT